MVDFPNKDPQEPKVVDNLNPVTIVSHNSATQQEFTFGAIVIGWINPEDIPVNLLRSIQASQSVRNLFPADGPTYPDLVVLRLAVVLLKAKFCRLSASSTTDCDYLLMWFFRYTGNREPDPDVFTDGTEFADWVDDENNRTLYKTANLLRITAPAGGDVVINEHFGEVGTTLDPMRKHRNNSPIKLEGDEAPIGRDTLKPNKIIRNGGRDLIPRSAKRCAQINAGRPDWKGVKLINTLVPGRRWCDIGSEIGFDFERNMGWITTQVYPTYTLYMYDGTQFIKDNQQMDSKSPYRNFRTKRRHPPEFVRKKAL